MSWGPDEIDIRVNFGKPLPVFPLDGMVLLPQQVVPLHIFERRYRQMVDRSLDHAGQIAMALHESAPTAEGSPLRRSVCVGQIIHHDTLTDGRYNILLQGVCRARVVRLYQPTDERLFIEAELEPAERPTQDGGATAELRRWIAEELDGGSLSRLGAAEDLLEYVRNDDIPSGTVAEIVSFTLVQDTETRYRLLAEPSPERRAGVLRAELRDLSRLIRLAERQRPQDWPRGVSWN